MEICCIKDNLKWRVSPTAWSSADLHQLPIFTMQILSHYSLAAPFTTIYYHSLPLPVIQTNVRWYQVTSSQQHYHYQVIKLYLVTNWVGINCHDIVLTLAVFCSDLPMTAITRQTSLDWPPYNSLSQLSGFVFGSVHNIRQICRKKIQTLQQHER